MEKTEFEKYFKCFEDELGNPTGRGNMDDAFIAAQYEESQKGVPMETICQKWKKYIDQCVADKTPDKYIKTMINFINHGTYNNDYGGSLKGKQSSFLDKYKKPRPVEPLSKQNKRITSIIECQEGDLGFDLDDEWIKILTNNRQMFFSEYNFVIKQNKETGVFTKINL